MAIENQDFTMYSNTDERLRFEIVDTSTGLPVPVGDILGASWGITPYEDDVSPIISKDLTTGDLTVPEDGIVLVVLNPSDTVDLNGEFTHELRLSDIERTYTASRGKITIRYQVSSNPL